MYETGQSAAQAQNYLYQAAQNSASPPPTLQTIQQRFVSMLEQLHSVESRLISISDSLHGSAPRGGAAVGELKAVSSGRIQELNDLANSFAVTLSGIQSEISRIENAIS
jgi:hypothetical protein